MSSRTYCPQELLNTTCQELGMRKSRVRIPFWKSELEENGSLQGGGISWSEPLDQQHELWNWWVGILRTVGRAQELTVGSRGRSWVQCVLPPSPLCFGQENPRTDLYVMCDHVCGDFSVSCRGHPLPQGSDVSSLCSNFPVFKCDCYLLQELLCLNETSHRKHLPRCLEFRRHFNT